MGFLWRSHPEKLVAVLDIGSGSVGVAFVQLGRGDVPTITYSARRELPFRKSIRYDDGRFLDDTLAALTHVLNDSIKAGAGRPERIDCFLASHFCLSQTRTKTFFWSKPTIITDDFINKTGESEAWNFAKENLIDRKSSNLISEEKAMQVLLNGYETFLPAAKEASEATISFYITLTPKDVYRGITKAVRLAFSNDDVNFHSFAFAATSVLRNILKEKDDFLFADVGSEITEVSLFSGGILSATESFPLGKTSLIRSVCQELKLDGGPAESMLSLYAKELLDKTTHKKITNAIDSAREKWAESFIVSAKKTLGDKRYLPPDFHVAVDGDVAPVFKQTLIKMNLSADLLLGRRPVVTLVLPSLFKDFCRNKSSCSDEFLMIEALFAGRLPGVGA